MSLIPVAETTSTLLYDVNRSTIFDQLLSHPNFDAQEPILQPAFTRFEFQRTKQHPGIRKLYNDHLNAFWKASEVDWAEDKKQWKLLDTDIQHFIKNILAFFATADGPVIEEVLEQLYNKCQLPESRLFFGCQIFFEGIHIETYNDALEIVEPDLEARLKLTESAENNPIAQRKVEWVLRWAKERNASYAHRLVAAVAIEGIFFSGAFCAIFWLKKKNLMPGLTYSNELISRDESLHCRHYCVLYDLLDHKLPVNIVHEMIREAVDIECDFVTKILPSQLIGMNADSMCQYIKYTADRWLDWLNVPPLYRVENPFDWMILMTLGGKANFFERKVSDYKKSNESTSLAQVDLTQADRDF